MLSKKICVFCLLDFILLLVMDFLRTCLIAQLVKHPSAMQESLVRFLGWEDKLEKG